LKIISKSLPIISSENATLLIDQKQAGFGRSVGMVPNGLGLQKVAENGALIFRP
jgi:hypothetical protein